MSMILRIATLGILVITLAAGVSSCGSASNNDQGTSFTAVGFRQLEPDEKDIGGYIWPLFADNASQVGSVFDGNSILTWIVLHNRLSNQFIRLVRVDCSYDIQGATVRIPDDAMVLAGVVEATPNPAGDVLTEHSEVVAPFELVSPDLFAFINNNMNSMPELPFRMNIACSATGVTQAGDTLTTNPIYIWVQFMDYEEGPGTGPVVGAGTGGDLLIAGGGEAPGTTAGGLTALSPDEADEVDLDSVADDAFVIE